MSDPDDEDTDDDATGFKLEGVNAEGKPKWLTYPCQGVHAEGFPGARCRVSINGQRNGSGATWQFSGSEEAPTIAPSIRCCGSDEHGKPTTICHFFIRGGRFTYCDDHPGKRG